MEIVKQFNRRKAGGHMVEETKKVTKMERAIYDTKLRLDNVKEKIMILSAQREILAEQLESLEIIHSDKLIKE